MGSSNNQHHTWKEGREGSWKEGRAEQGKGDLECPEKGEDSFKRGCWISLLEKGRFELRLEGAQGVRLALSRGKLSPAKGVAQAGHPDMLEKQEAHVTGQRGEGAGGKL